MKTSPIETHPIQRKIWFDKNRFKLWCAGRRTGKTTYAKEKLASSSDISRGLFWYIGPTRGHAKELLWEELKFTYRYYGFKYTKNEVDLTITRLRTQSRVSLKGGEKIDRLRGKGLNGALFDEFADINFKAWTECIRPALSDKRGWCDFLGTPKGFNHFYKMFNEAKTKDNWSAYQSRTIDSPIFQTPEGKQELLEAMADLDERTYRQEYEASFETWGGRICYAFDRARHNTDIDYDPNLAIYIGQDFNRTPMSSCLFQLVAGKMIQFGELFLMTSSTDEVCRVIKDKFPQAIFKGIIMRPDATGKRKTSNASRSDFEIIKEHGFNIDVGNSNPSRLDRWTACNRGFEKDQVLINVKNCPKTVDDLESIVYKEGTCEPDIKDPLKGHLFDAFGYNVYKQFPVIQIREAQTSKYA